MSNKIFTTKSGIELPIAPVNEFDLAPYVKQLTQGGPKPPQEFIDGMLIPNEAHPDYLEALEAHNLAKGAYMMGLYIEFGLDVELNEEQQASIDRAKKKMERLNPGAPENKLDLYLYAKSVCPTSEELTRLFQAIQGLNNPTAEAVQDALDTFRPGVPGPGTNDNQDAPKWNRFSDWQPETDPVQSGDLGGDRDTALLRGPFPRVAG